MTFTVGKKTEEWAKEKKLSCLYQVQMDSTNLHAKTNSVRLVLTDDQTAGRGRGQNLWNSPARGDALLSSWVFESAAAPHPLLTCRLGLAVWSSLQKTFAFQNFSIKAPNDIYCENKKIAGLLVETFAEKSQWKIVLGLGLNVFSDPGLDLSGNLVQCLQKKASDYQMTAGHWNLFLDQLYFEFVAVFGSLSDQLTGLECENLKYALNNHTPLSDPILQVSGNASLKFKSKSVHWMDL